MFPISNPQSVRTARAKSLQIAKIRQIAFLEKFFHSKNFVILTTFQELSPKSINLQRAHHLQIERKKSKDIRNNSNFFCSREIFSSFNVCFKCPIEKLMVPKSPKTCKLKEKETRLKAKKLNQISFLIKISPSIFNMFESANPKSLHTKIINNLLIARIRQIHFFKKSFFPWNNFSHFPYVPNLQSKNYHLQKNYRSATC